MAGNGPQPNMHQRTHGLSAALVSEWMVNCLVSGGAK